MDQSLQGSILIKNIENRFQDILDETKNFVKNWVINESVSLHDEDDEEEKIDLAGEDKGIPDAVLVKIHSVNQILNSTLAQALKEIEQNLNPIKARAYAQITHVLKKHYAAKIREKLIPAKNPPPSLKQPANNEKIEYFIKNLSLRLYEDEDEEKKELTNIAKDLAKNDNEFVQQVFDYFRQKGYYYLSSLFIEEFISNDTSLGTRNKKIFMFLLDRVYNLELIKHLVEKAPHTQEFSDFVEKASEKIEEIKRLPELLSLAEDEYDPTPSEPIKRETTLFPKKYFSSYLLEKKAVHPFAEILNNIIYKNHDTKKYAAILNESLKNNNNFYAASLEAIHKFKDLPTAKTLNEAYDDVNYGSPAFMKQVVVDINKVLLEPLKKQHPELETLIDRLAAGVSNNLETLKYRNDPEHKPPIRHKEKIERVKKILGTVFLGSQLVAISKALDEGKPFKPNDVEFIISRAKRTMRITEENLKEIQEVLQTIMK
jgi:hypothetical protein